MRLFAFGFATLFAFTLLCDLAYADPRTAREDVFQVQDTFGDGSDGRIFKKWTKNIQDRPVERVEIILRRTQGSDSTYVNLRYGNDSTFENGKREHLRSTNITTKTWNVGGARPNGKQLVLNVYKGEVYIEEVRVVYQAVHVGLPGRLESGSGRDRYDHDGGPDRYDRDGIPNERDAKRRCRRQDIRSPRIDIGRVRSSGGMLSGKYRIEGSLIGSCIKEAGYFEHGRMKKEFEFPLDDQFRREEFELRVRSGKAGEIRILTTDGQEDSISVDRLIGSGEWLR
jgi:hypothetical protein